MSKKKRTKGKPVQLSVPAVPAPLQAFADPARQARAAAVVPLPFAKEMAREVGVPGTAWSGWTPFDSYNPNLQGPTWCAVVDEMRRCGPITAIELCITMPVAETDWTIEGDSQELCELCELALFSAEGLSTTWSDVVRRAAMSALYGTWLFELVWGQAASGPVVWRRLADRLPGSIYGYDLAEDRGLRAVRQRGQVPGLGGGYVDLEIPVEKMLLFPYRMEGANWHGISILRGAYIHWYCCQLLYRIANTGVEHNLLGIPAMQLPSNWKDEDRSAALAMLQSVYRHEASALVLPPGWELLDTSHLGNGQIDTLPLIEHHRNELFRCAMIGWVLGGDTSFSNQAGVDAMMHFGLIVWNFLAKSIADVFNRHGLPRLVRMNTTAEVKSADMPRLRPADIGGLLRLQQAAEFIKALTDGGFVKPDSELEDENWFRAGLGMPERSAEAADVPPPKPPATTPEGEADQAEQTDQAGAAEKVTAFADPQRAVETLGRTQAAAEDSWQRAGQELLAGLLEELLRQLEAGVEVGRLVVPPTLVDDYTEWITAWLEDVWRGTGAAVEPPPELAGRARMIAEDHAQAARVEVQRAALDGASAAEIAGRYGEAMGRRLRVDLKPAPAEAGGQRG